MKYLIYDTCDSNNFFQNVADSFWEESISIIRKLASKIKEVGKIPNSQKISDFTILLCNKIYTPCTHIFKSVILSNEQIRIFIDSRDKKYDALNQTGDQKCASAFKEVFLEMRSVAKYMHLRTVDGSGKIVNYVSPKYTKPGTQTINDFFSGVVNSLNQNESVHYVAYELKFPPVLSEDYQNFSTKYAAKKGNPPDHCSTETSPECGLLKKVNLINSIKKVAIDANT